jgi:hypothetical protein
MPLIKSAGEVKCAKCGKIIQLFLQQGAIVSRFNLCDNCHSSKKDLEENIKEFLNNKKIKINKIK